MSVKVTFNLDLGGLDDLRKLKGKARTAAAKALTFTAQDGQLAVKASLPGAFHLRNGWVEKGIRITPASGASMTAVVGSIDKYMERHVVGAGKPKPPEKALSISRKRDARGRFAKGGLTIMPYGSIGQYPTHTAVRRKLRRVDGQQKKTFQILSKSGNQVLIVRRRSKKRTPLEVLGMLRGEAVDIKADLDMVGTIRATVSGRFLGHFERAIAKI